MIYIVALISILLGSLAQYLLKIGMMSFSCMNKDFLNILKGGITNLYLLAGISCYGISMIFWLYVLSKLELSKAYPLVSLGYVFTLIIGYLFLNESINFLKIFGVTFIFIGVICITKA